ncbi:MAG: hypothetical protein COU47_00445 [Candidatus Niyogibacteria bacterium CG10_big_fil_rev_8_21_14_0_10_46_36]|uniref:GlxA-like beta barrel domain-containing protein n=1 Tax=Candidatus Niyogibacteria bacterium CG10_big_fil_rev_8_21_14_0_10_46_36 TaxID=1974726 RepID=A0A2H0TEC2_9BACT|nr:MAG: hypothetical protein COU47_00445 [Candidatus Niyogibacteria bacterium CG10_big_fil_rev_8_21_14_0_10_46_36]
MHDMVVKKTASSGVSKPGAHIPIRRVAPKKEEEPKVSFAEKQEDFSAPVSVVKTEAHTVKADSFFAKMKPAHTQKSFKPKTTKRKRSEPQGNGTRRWYGTRPFFILYGVLAFTLFLLIVDMMSGVTVAVTPHQEFFNIDTLVKFSASESTGARVETVHLEETIEGRAETQGEKDVEEKASGKLTIYNEFSSDPQVLVRRTRFETEDGKIYRIAEQVTVPGANVKDGTIEASSIEVIVYADEPGEEYNIGPAEFTIPGFKGSPRFDKFYARSFAGMTGGFKGKTRVVTEKDAADLSSSLQTQLSEELKRQATNELPEGLLIPAGASRITTIAKDFSADIGKPADQLTLNMSLRLDGLAVSFETIEAEIINKYLAKDDTDPEAFDIVNVHDLSYSTEDVDFDAGTMTLRIQGLAHVAWHIDYDGLTSALAHADYRKQVRIFSQYASIEEAAISFFPSWWRVFPNNTDKIIIERRLFDSP